MTPYVEPQAQLVTEIFVRDIGRSIAFYQALGFELMVHRDEFAILTWEACQLFLDQQDFAVDPPASPLANIRVMVPDVDAAWDRAIALGTRVWAPIENRSYGLRDFTILDPDGFGIRFGSWLAPPHDR